MEGMRVSSGPYAGVYHCEESDSGLVWIHEDRPDSLPIANRTMQRWVERASAKLVGEEPVIVAPVVPVAEPVLAPAPVAPPAKPIPLVEPRDPAPMFDAELSRDARPQTQGEESFLEEVREWNRAKRLSFLRYLGVAVNDAMTKDHLAYLLLMARRKKDAPVRPADADKYWLREYVPDPETARRLRERSTHRERVETPPITPQRHAEPSRNSYDASQPIRSTIVVQGGTIAKTSVADRFLPPPANLNPSRDFFDDLVFSVSS